MPGRAQGQHHGQSPAGGVLGGQRAAHRLGEAARHREAEPDAGAARGVPIALEGLEYAFLRLVRHPGPAVDDADLHPVGQRARGDEDRCAGRAVLDRVLDEVGHRPLQEPGVDGDHGQRLGDVELHAVLGDPAERHRHHLVHVDLADQRGDGAGLQPGHVEQVAHQVVEPVGALLDAFEEFRAVLLRPGHVVRAQRADRRLDAGERGAQVVADGCEQRGADAVALGERPGLLGGLPQSLPVQDDRGLRGERGQHPAVGGGQHPSGQGERHVVAYGHVHVGVLGPRHARAGAHRARAGPRGHAPGAFQQRRRLHGEGLPDPLQERLQAGLPAQHAAREEGEYFRLGAQPGRLMGAPGGEVDDGGDRDGDPDEDQDGDDVLGIGDGEAVQRGCVEVVEEHRAERGGGERREQPAEQGGGHGQRQEEQHVVGEAEVDGVEQQREDDRAGDAGGPARDDPGTAEPGAAGGRQSAPLGDLVVGDDVHVQVGPAVAGHRGAHAGAEDVLPGLAARGAEHDLRGVGAAREVEQGGGDVVAHHVVEGAAEVLDEGALDREFLGRGGGQPVAAGDVDGEHLAAGPLLGEPRSPADQGAALGSAGQPDDDPLPGAPYRRDPVLAAVLGQVLVDPVGDPQQGQLAQSGEVAGAEVVREGGVDLVRLVDVAVRHAAAQRLGRHVDQFDLVGAAHELVGDGLPLPHPGDRLDDVAE